MMSNLTICTPAKDLIRLSPFNPPKDEEYLTQLLLIQRQSDLISEIEKNITKSRKKKVGFDQASEFSLSTLQNSHFLSNSKSTLSLHRQSSSFSQSSLQQVLNEIKRHCSKKAYCFVREKFRNLDQSRIESRLQKEIKYNQQLMRRCMKLSHEVNELKAKLEGAEAKIKVLEKSKVSKDQSMNLERGEIFIKWEKSMLHKQKLQAEVKKYLNRQFSALQEEKKLNENIRQEISFMLEKIEPMGKNKFDMSSFAKEIKLNLEEQRLLAKKQAQQFHSVQRELESILKGLKQTVGLQK